MAFPTTPILDTATRANENPLSDGGQWSKFTGIANQLQISSNMMTGTAGSQAVNGSYWNNLTLSNNAGEIYFTIGSKQLVTNDFMAAIIANVSSLNGYFVQYTENTTSGDSIFFARLDGGAETVINTYAQEVTAGDKIGLQVINGNLTAWYCPVSSGIWTSLGKATDATYSIKGMNLSITLAYTAVSGGITNFGGGNPVGSRLPLLGVG